MLIQNLIDKPHRRLSSLHPLPIDHGDDTAERRRTRTGPKQQREIPIHGNDIVRTIDADVGEAARRLRVVEAVGAVLWRRVGEPLLDRFRLVLGQREDVAEAAAAADHRLAGRFGLRARR